MKKFKIWGTAIGFVLAGITAGIAISILAQTELDDDSCKWHVEHSPKGGASTNYTATYALMWNDCTGELHYIKPDWATDTLTSDEIQL